MIQKLLAMTSIMVMIFNSFTCFSQTSYYNLNVNEADIVCIDFKISSGQGRPQTVTEAYLMKNFNFQTTDKIYIAYITHYLNSLELINDGIISGGADGDYAYMYLTHKDGGKENFLFAFDKFIDDDNKQYAIDKTMYIRLIDFIYALKAEKIIIDNISELPSQWCEGEIEKAVNDGLVPKWNQINYTGEISRLEVCQLIDNYLKLCAVEAEEAPKTPFSDTNDPSVAALSALGIIDGKTETEFCPYDFATREELAKILYNTYCLTSKNDVKSSETNYLDKASISPWAEEYVNKMTSLGIFSGDKQGNFCPKDTATKEQLILTLLRLKDITSV